MNWSSTPSWRGSTSASAHLIQLQAQPATATSRFAIDCVEAALRQALAASLVIAESLDEERVFHGLCICGADESTPHWTECPDRLVAPVLAQIPYVGIEQYQAESR
jgi:hypothetical protein